MRRRGALLISVPVVLVAAIAFGVARSGRGPGPNVVAAVEDGYTGVELQRRGARSIVVSDEGEHEARAELIEAGVADPQLPDVDYASSFLLLAEWDSCPHDRAEVLLQGSHLWVAGVDNGWDCEQPIPTLSPTVLDRDLVGARFTLGSRQEPATVQQYVDGAEVHVVRKIDPALQGGLGRSLAGQEPDVTLVLAADEIQQLLDDERLWSIEAGQQPLDAPPPDDLLLVTTSGCTRHVWLGVSGDQVRILPLPDDREGCEATTLAWVFVLDEQLPELPFSAGFDSFFQEPTMQLGS